VLISAAFTGKIEICDKAASNKQSESRVVTGPMG
jgi:hypothetical protein